MARRDRVELDAELLNRTRVRQGLSQSDLARKACVSVNSTRRALSGAPVGLEVSTKIVAALGMPFSKAVARELPLTVRV